MVHPFYQPFSHKLPYLCYKVQALIFKQTSIWSCVLPPLYPSRHSHYNPMFRWSQMSIRLLGHRWPQGTTCALQKFLNSRTSWATNVAPLFNTCLTCWMRMTNIVGIMNDFIQYVDYMHIYIYSTFWPQSVVVVFSICTLLIHFGSPLLNQLSTSLDSSSRFGLAISTA